MPERIFRRCMGSIRLTSLKYWICASNSAIQTGQLFEDSQIKQASDHCRILQNMFGQLGQAVNAGAQAHRAVSWAS